MSIYTQDFNTKLLFLLDELFVFKLNLFNLLLSMQTGKQLYNHSESLSESRLRFFLSSSFTDLVISLAKAFSVDLFNRDLPSLPLPPPPRLLSCFALQSLALWELQTH